jgi:flagellin
VTASGVAGFVLTAKTGQGTAANGSVVVTGAGGAGTGSKTIAAGSFTTAGVAATGQGVMKIDMTSYADSTSSTVSISGTIDALDNAIAGVSQARADFGAVVNTLEYSIDNLNNAIANTSAAKSAIMDADYAAETTELARTQIISQAATAMLSQANQQAQSVLALLK